MNGLAYGGASVLASSLDMRVGCEGSRFRFLAAAYGLTIAGVVVPAPGQEPSAGEVAALVTAIRETGVSAIFSEAQFDPSLAATLAVVPSIPVAGLALILGVDRFMSEARSITNFIGNAVATLIVSKWEGALDTEKARHVRRGQPN